MVLHAIPFTPIGFAAGSLLEVAFFRMNNAGIALSETLETGKAITLVKTFTRHAAAVYTVNFARKNQRNVFTQQFITGNFIVA
jgi:hypothetical protein